MRQREQRVECDGIIVDKVLPDSTAAAAGVERGDIILSINGSKVTDVVGFLVQVSMIKPGDMVEVEIVRAGKKMVKRGTMLERPREKRNG